MTPSDAALRRLDRVQDALLELGGQASVKQIREELSEPMSRADLDAALRRLEGAEMVTVTIGRRPRLYVLTPYGCRMGELKRKNHGVTH